MCMMCMMGHSMDHTAHPNPAAQAGSRDESLLHILKRRFAMGEIDQSQLAEMKRVLGIEETPETPSRHLSPEHH